MSASPYRRIEKAIAAADAGAVWERWAYGRRLLARLVKAANGDMSKTWAEAQAALDGTA